MMGCCTACYKTEPSNLSSTVTRPDFGPTQVCPNKRNMSLLKALSRRKYAKSQATYRHGRQSTTPHALAIRSATTYFGRQAVSSISTTPDFSALRLESSDIASPAQQGSFCQSESYCSSPDPTFAMSLPPNVIRVKRKRVEEPPVTFLRTPLSRSATLARRVHG